MNWNFFFAYKKFIIGFVAITLCTKFFVLYYIFSVLKGIFLSIEHSNHRGIIKLVIYWRIIALAAFAFAR